MSREFSGTPIEVIGKVQKRITKVTEEIKSLKVHINELKESYQNTILRAYTYLKMEEETTKIKNETARTNMFFYLSGWIVDREREKVLKELAKYVRPCLPSEVRQRHRQRGEVSHHVGDPQIGSRVFDRSRDERRLAMQPAARHRHAIEILGCGHDRVMRAGRLLDTQNVELQRRVAQLHHVPA